MADVEYSVVIEYLERGQLGADIRKAVVGAGELGSKLGDLAGRVSEAIEPLSEGFRHAVEHAAALGAHIAKWGTVGAIGGLAYGVAHLNNEMESLGISMASIFQAQGWGTFAQTTKLAGDQINKMKQDVKTLPGDLGNLSSSMMQVMGPMGSIAGMTPDKMREFAGKTLLASQILLGAKYGSNALEVGSREMTMLLQGHTGSRNMLAQVLPGIQGRHDLATMDPKKRFEEVEKAINAITKDSSKAFGNSWVAQTTTLKDNLKYAFLQPLTSPLFDNIKITISKINTFWDNNKEKITHWAEVLGVELGRAWERGMDLAQEWWPKILSFAEQLRDKLSVVWERFAPAIAEVANYLGQIMSNGDLSKDIGKILELYAASKGSEMGSSFGRGIGTVTGAMFGGTGGAAAGGAVGDELGWGALSLPFGMFMKAQGIGMAGALMDKPEKTAQAMEYLANATQRLTDAFDTSISPALEDFAITNIKMAASALEELATAIHAASSAFTWIKSQFGIMGKEDPMEDIRSLPRDMELHMTHALSIPMDYSKELAKKGGGPGGGGTHVQKVEIVVNSNQDANRVAEMVVKKITTLSRHPRVSPNSPNYSG